MKDGTTEGRKGGTLGGPRIVTLMAALAVLSALPPSRLSAQSPDIRARLEARGLPAELVQQVVDIAADATAQGLPTAPLADKAIEGWAKQVPAPRIVSAVRLFGTRMQGAQAAVRNAGVREPDGDVVTAAAEAMGRGFEPSQIGRLVRAAPQPALAASGLTVAAALAAQGMAAPRAVDVVTSTMQNGGTTAQILDLPSVARSMQSHGLSPDEAGQRMLRGGPGDGARPPSGDGSHQGQGSGGLDGRPPGSGGPPPRPPGSGEGRGPGGHGPGMPGGRPD